MWAECDCKVGILTVPEAVAEVQEAVELHTVDQFWSWTFWL